MTAPSEKTEHREVASIRRPLWARSLLAMDRVVNALARVEVAVRDEVMAAWLPADRRASWTQTAYGRTRSYPAEQVSPGSYLFAWEQRLLARTDFPRTGHVLLGGAGGGREIAGLCARGYSVFAFEPSELVGDAQSLAETLPDVEVWRACYADVVSALESHSGPLFEALLRRPFDAIVLGWDSLSHVLEHDDRHALLSALRRLAPAAPVIASFFVQGRGTVSPRLQRLQRGLRATFAALGAPAKVSPGLRFLPTIGFSHLFSREEIEALAAGAGYVVDEYDVAPCGHVLLVPRT